MPFIPYLVHPQLVSARKSIVVVAQTNTLRQLAELVCVPSAEDNIFGFKRRDEPFDHIDNVLAPFHFAQALEARSADVIFKRLALPVWQMSQLHRFNHTIDDHRCAETRTEAEKQHFSALIAAKCLHGGIVDDLDRAAERLLEVEIGPPASKIVRLGHHAVAHHQAGVPNGNGVVAANPRRGVSPRSPCAWQKALDLI